VPQVALNWLLQRPSVANVIIGARNEEQLRQNIAAVGWNLTPAQVKKLDVASELPYAYPYWHQASTARDRQSAIEIFARHDDVARIVGEHFGPIRQPLLVESLRVSRIEGFDLVVQQQSF